MPEYIDREAIKKMLENAQIISDGEYSGYCTEDINVDDIPAADVAPVAYGRWEDGNEFCPICGKSKFDGLEADIWADWKPKRCPNCGAKMQEVQ